MMSEGWNPSENGTVRGDRYKLGSPHFTRYLVGLRAAPLTIQAYNKKGMGVGKIRGPISLNPILSAPFLFPSVRKTDSRLLVVWIPLLSLSSSSLVRTSYFVFTNSHCLGQALLNLCTLSSVRLARECAEWRVCISCREAIAKSRTFLANLVDSINAFSWNFPLSSLVRKLTFAYFSSTVF